jgi:hypothetical protein
MKKNYFYLLPVLALMVCTGLQAQVTIGGDTDPAAGAILDLNSPGGVKGGLLLSSIAIADLSEIPANELWGISSAQGENEYLRGIMVYNTGTPGVPAGIYVWNGYCWTPDGSYTPIVTTSSPAVTVSEYADLTVIADGYPPFVYTWYKNTAPSTTDGTKIEGTNNAATYQTPTGLANGVYYYYCTVKSDYSDVEAVSDLFTVTVCVPPAQPGTISGSTSVTSGATGQIYSVEAVDEATSYEWTLPSGSGWTGSSTTNSITVTVGTLGGDISVKAKNSCGSSGAQTQTLTVIVCPGYVCVGCAYDYVDNTPGDGAKGQTPSSTNTDETWAPNLQIGDLVYTATDNALFNAFTSTSVGNLCVYKVNGNSGSVTDWPNAVQACNGAKDDFSDWYLPNLRELRALYNALGGSGSSATGSASDFGTGGAAMQFSLYWSSTEDSSDNAYYFDFDNGNRLNYGKTTNLYVRCVRRM